VFSADVLEHIRPQEADAVVSELIRVAKRHIVLSISHKSYQNAGLHTLLRPRPWWEARFAAHGARPNRPLVWALQQKETRFQREKDFSHCKWEGNATEGGLYEVCTAAMVRRGRGVEAEAWEGEGDGCRPAAATYACPRASPAHRLASPLLSSRSHGWWGGQGRSCGTTGASPRRMQSSNPGCLRSQWTAS
jgi:hypothetical protein